LYPGSFPICLPACLSCQPCLPARLAWPPVSLACLPTHLAHSTWAPLLLRSRCQSSCASLPLSSSSIPFP
ncbi:hypothetical protein AAFF_G00406520, partial [Aldrovandia affinis]